MALHPVAGPATGTKEAVLGFAQAVSSARMNEVEAFLDELFDLGARCGYNPFLIAAQSAVETGDNVIGGGWLNRWWRERLNPGAIGITGHPPQDEASQTWNNGRDAARGMLLHHAAYRLELHPLLEPFRALNKRYELARDMVAASPRGPVRHWEDLGNGFWAVDPNYAAIVLRRAAEISEFEPGGVIVPGPLPIDFVEESGSLLAVQGAVARDRPARDGTEIRMLAAGTRHATDGMTDDGEDIFGSSRWYRLVADRSWVHSSGGVYSTLPEGRLPLSAIWGRPSWDQVDPELTQEHGMTAFATHPDSFDTYEYSLHYCRDWCPNPVSPANCSIGHPGLDIGVSFGTQLFTPAAGRVICAGTGHGGDPANPDPFSPGCVAFDCEPANFAAQSGRFEIELENGDRLLIGHLSRVTVQHGQHLNAGDPIGRSGHANGDHIHLEYRQRAPLCIAPNTSPMRMVDPRDMFS
jgi:hypothetical protein